MRCEVESMGTKLACFCPEGHRTEKGGDGSERRWL
ncbi:MAG: hypothetical protein FJW36_10400 [Acidobacteria bacterium]|nr:hypothetical protein [Acidobacteriota bacterium]